SGRSTSSTPATISRRPPQKGRLRRQARHRARLVIMMNSLFPDDPGPSWLEDDGQEKESSRAGSTEAEPEVGQRERARGGQPGVLDEVVDLHRVGLLAEAARGAGGARVLAERPGVQADADVVEGRLAAGLPGGVDDQVVRFDRVARAARGQVQGDRA